MAWALLFGILLVIEIVTVNLVSIWFAIGALGAYITSLLTTNVIIQIIVFVIISVVSLLIIRNFVKKKVNKKVIRTNADMAIGKAGKLLEAITKHEFGEMKLDGKMWMVDSKKPIEKGKEVKVLAISGVKLIVEEVEGGNE